MPGIMGGTPVFRQQREGKVMEDRANSDMKTNRS
jgi:hypothetical protein